MDFDQYEKGGRATYAEFAEVVADILRAAIRVESGFRLQQVTHRAKQPPSLKKKLTDRKKLETQQLEDEIKDLAGCRVIFYTNNDVYRFLNSGITHENFEVLEAKIHHPKQGSEDASELYISNHFVVRLRAERAALPEYTHLKGMRCEVQVQTILNHAWAEMAHDTIYKEPDHGDFGNKIIDSIKDRLRKVSEKYLLPAGYEFQRIANDFDRLMAGKALFDQNALDLIVDATDNNARMDALRNFSEGVLPLYDNPQQEYPQIVRQLLVAAERSIALDTVDIETPYGVFPGKTPSDILKGILEVLGSHRYLDVEVTFTAICDLYREFGGERDREAIIDVAKALAKHHLHIWTQHGPVVQLILLDSLEVLEDTKRRGMSELLLAVIGQILGSEVTATTSDSSTVTWQQGVVVVSEHLRTMRSRALAWLRHQYSIAEDAAARYNVLKVMQSGTRLPLRGHPNELIQLVLENAEQVIDFQAEHLPDLEFDMQQSAEHWVHHLYRTFGQLPEAMQDDSGLMSAAESMRRAALAFRDTANSNPEFTIYKVLVGFNSIYPPAWSSDRFQYEQAKSYRSQQVQIFLDGIDANNAEEWFERVKRFAKIRSADLATFPVFGEFLEKWANKDPVFFLTHIHRVEDDLARFIPGIFSGLMQSAEYVGAYSTICALLESGRSLQYVAWYLRGADTVGLPYMRRHIGSLLRKAIGSGVRLEDWAAMRNVLLAAAAQYEVNPTRLIRAIFLKALKWLSSKRDEVWLGTPWISWGDNKLLQSLDETDAKEVLSALVPYSRLEGAVEDIAAVIAGRWPKLAINFLTERQVYARGDIADSSYDAVPFSIDSLREPLAAVPDLLLAEARAWFEADALRFTYDGGRILGSTFINLIGLERVLQELIATGVDKDLEFVSDLLCAYEGRPCVDPFVHSILTRLSVESPLIDDMRAIYRESGTVSGEFGFVNLYAERRARISPWLCDESASIKQFAEGLDREFEQRILQETRSAQTSLAMRRLHFGEDVDGGKSAEGEGGER